MLEYEVTNRAGMVAAVKAAAQPTFEQAKQNPVQIKCGGTTYSFKEGISEQRAKALLQRIMETSKKAFEVK